MASGLMIFLLGEYHTIANDNKNFVFDLATASVYDFGEKRTQKFVAKFMPAFYWIKYKGLFAKTATDGLHHMRRSVICIQRKNLYIRN